MVTIRSDRRGLNPWMIAAVAAAAAALGRGASADPIVFQANGPNSLSIQSNVDAFRAALGTLNPNTPESFMGGRREINWDAVPDAFSSPNVFPGDFFNAGFAPRARGAVFSTPGSHFEVSADDSNPTNTPVEFGHLDPSYENSFATFSPQRLFSPIGSTVTDVNFFLPIDQTTPGTVSGFGAVFTDVDIAGLSRLEFYDASNNLLFVKDVPASSGHGTLSFLGVFFNGGEQVGRVRVVSGNTNLGPGAVDSIAAERDVVALDDFIYGEPIPEPATAVLLIACLLAARRNRR